MSYSIMGITTCSTSMERVLLEVFPSTTLEGEGSWSHPHRSQCLSMKAQNNSLKQTFHSLQVMPLLVFLVDMIVPICWRTIYSFGPVKQCSGHYLSCSFTPLLGLPGSPFLFPDFHETYNFTASLPRHTRLDSERVRH